MVAGVGDAGGVVTVVVVFVVMVVVVVFVAVVAVVVVVVVVEAECDDELFAPSMPAVPASFGGSVLRLAFPGPAMGAAAVAGRPPGEFVAELTSAVLLRGEIDDKFDCEGILPSAGYFGGGSVLPFWLLLLLLFGARAAVCTGEIPLADALPPLRLSPGRLDKDVLPAASLASGECKSIMATMTLLTLSPKVMLRMRLSSTIACGNDAQPKPQIKSAS